MTTMPASGPDSPAEAAREYLARHQAPVNMLPPSRMMAEIEALRGLLGQVLATLNGQAAPAAPGPFADQREAADAVRHVTSLPPGTGQWAAACQQLLLDACAAAGLTFGSYDHEIVEWLAGFEPWVVAVIAGLIGRARAAGEQR